MATKGVKKAKKPVKAKPLTAGQKLDALGIDAICEKVANCETLQSIADGAKVTKWCLIQWINSDANHDAHARARERGADKHAEDILAIADELVIEAKYNGEDVSLDVSSAAIARNRLRVDTRKWLAAKMNAKKYGEKITQEVTGENGGPVKHNIAVSFVAP